MLEERFREILLGHLSDHNTELDIKNACIIDEEFALEFAIYIHNAGRNKDLQKEIKEVFETFKKEI